jgi:site-specific DNA recombinase
MIRAAIYARFSSDRQNDRSVDDQIASCRELCAREGFTVVLTFCDREISGASTVNRPGFQDLMRAAEALRFDVIVAEDVDRISRDQGDWHTARKRLDFLGIAIHTASGKVGKLDGALRLGGTGGAAAHRPAGASRTDRHPAPPLAGYRPGG